MPRPAIHRFELNNRRFAIDPDTCFCFECDEISWDVLTYYPFTSANRIYHELGSKHSVRELAEVIGELEWLRATKSIFPVLKPEDLRKQLETEPGLKTVSVRLPREHAEAVPARRGWFGQSAVVHASSARDLGRDAVALLLNRSAQQKEVRLEFIETNSIHNPALIADLCAHALRGARLADKQLTAAVQVADVAITGAPEALKGHTVSVKLEFRATQDVAGLVKALAKALAQPTLGRLVKALQPDADEVTGRIVVRPNHPEFGGVVPELDAAGFTTIELDLDGAYTANPGLEPKKMLSGLSKSAVYYAQQLLQHKYFRLDPIAPLFWRIYDGAPLRRADPMGVNELAVDSDGFVYPSWRLMGIAECRVGSLVEGELDEAALAGFVDFGSQAVGSCRRCWARNLCGGGTGAVHFALSGSVRRPHEAWCDAQRQWMTAAVSAFQLLSSHGVNFTRVYNSLTKSAKPGLFNMLRAAMGMTVAMRPIEESDAEMLVRWENWNEAAYFTLSESGLLLATRYDREMDSLHPQGVQQEMVVIRKTGEPIGLFRVRPERVPGAAQAWVYLRREADYLSDDVRKGFRFLLKQAGAQQSIRRLTVQVSEQETALEAFLQAIDFRKEGTLREALYLHGGYRDVQVYGIVTETL